MMPDGSPDVFTQINYGCNADEVSKIVFLSMRKNLISEICEMMKNVNETNGFRQCFHGELNGHRITLIDSGIGAPVATDAVYFLRFTKCRAIIYTGLIGALQENIRIGDIIVPTASYRGEGASKYFVQEPYPAVADFELTKIISSTLGKTYQNYDVNIHYGPIYTTDAFAAETPEFLEEWKNKNLLGIEMETSAIYVIASLYGIRASSFHVVSDNTVTKNTFFDPLIKEDETRRNNCQNIVKNSMSDMLPSIVELVKGEDGEAQTPSYRENG